MKRPKLWYSRGYLRHFDGGELFQFITFRLADSLPQNVLRQWKSEMERKLITDLELQRKIEKYLDSNRGECYLKMPEIASVLLQISVK